jgi:hypothetical protein
MGINDINKLADGDFKRELLINSVRPGDRVTIVDRFGKTHSGRAVMPCVAGGWVLNMGGRYGTPGIATDANTVAVKKARKS